MSAVFLHWFSWNQSFITCWLPICPLLFRYLHNDFTLYKKIYMQNVLNNGEQHDIATIMTIKVGYILWSYQSCFYKSRSCCLCFCFLAHGVFFYLLNLKVVLQAKELFGLQSHWFLSLHDFLIFILYDNLVDCKSLVLERPI